MEKEALLGIVLNDINEVALLMGSIKGKPQLMPAFIDLSIKKIESIKQELELLQRLADMPVEATAPVAPQPTVVAPVVPVATAKPEVVAETVAAPADVPVPEPQPVKEELPPPVVVPPVTVPRPPVAQVAPPAPQPEQKPVEVAPEEVPAPHKHPDKIEFELTHEQQHAHHAAKHVPTLGETLVSEKSSVLDKINAAKEPAASVLMGKPVDDIKKAIGINDRFLFQRELFDNNASQMNQTIDELNRMASFAEAINFLKTNFSWDEQDETTQSFINIVRRKFN